MEEGEEPIEIQEERLRSWIQTAMNESNADAMRPAIRLIGCEGDLDVSGRTRLLDRPVGKRLAEMIARGEVTEVWVRDLGRLARNSTSWHQIKAFFEHDNIGILAQAVSLTGRSQSTRAHDATAREARRRAGDRYEAQEIERHEYEAKCAHWDAEIVRLTRKADELATLQRREGVAELNISSAEAIPRGMESNFADRRKSWEDRGEGQEEFAADRAPPFTRRSNERRYS